MKEGGGGGGVKEAEDGRLTGRGEEVEVKEKAKRSSWLRELAAKGKMKRRSTEQDMRVSFRGVYFPSVSFSQLLFGAGG